MKESADHIDQLLAKYLANEATAQEQMFVQSWLTEDSVNQKYFEQVSLIFEKSKSAQKPQTFDTDAAWVKVKSQLKGKEEKVIKLSSGSTFTNLLRIAASIVLVAGVGYFLNQQFTKPTDQIAVRSAGSIVSQPLPDGSKIVLNKQSSVEFEFDPKVNTRKVKLRGEGYFDVKHEEEKPFIIETQGVLIADIGTTFNVKSYDEMNTVEVYVESGEVKLYTQDNEGLNVKAGETGVYNKTLRSFTFKATLDPNILSYKDNVFVFTNTDLKTIIERINEAYDVKLKLANEEIGQCRITVNFKDETIESIADILAETLSLEVLNANGQIILNGKGCPD